jgi:hypothetical protein
MHVLNPTPLRRFARLLDLNVSLALGDMHRKGKVEKVGRGRAMRWKLAVSDLT